MTNKRRWNNQQEELEGPMRGDGMTKERKWNNKGEEAEGTSKERSRKHHKCKEAERPMARYTMHGVLCSSGKPSSRFGNYEISINIPVPTRRRIVAC